MDRRKTIAEHAADVLRETDNPAVMWGDCGLLDLIFVRAGMSGSNWPNERHKRVLDALEGSPLFEKRYSMGSGVRVFRLKPTPAP